MSQDGDISATVTTPSSPRLSQIVAPPSLKRSATSFECSEDNSRKRLKEETGDMSYRPEPSLSGSIVNFVDELAQELQCGCCSELVYKPVLVMPCQHFFCGSCCVLWIRNGGTNCPACRGISTVAMPFRGLQSVIDTLLRAAPYKARTEREKQQADEVYKTGHSLRLPPPRETSPPPDVNRSTEFVHPCPHCVPGNPYDWRCPQPIPDPNTDAEPWHVDDGVPPGHAHCGNCENLLALRAPATTRCDLCLVSFCGIGVQDRCSATSIMSQQPHGMTSLADMIQSSDVYECFGGNTVEVDIMLEYLETQRLSPRHIYREIVQFIQKQPRGFTTLIELELFIDVHGVTPGTESNANAPRNKICRPCATEVLLWGLKDWWIRERQKGFLEEGLMNRHDCPEGSSCTVHKDDLSHARQFNHLFPRSLPEVMAPTVPVVENANANADITTPSIPEVPENFVRAPSPLPPNASSSTSSLSFLLNGDPERNVSSPPEFRSPTPDIHAIVDTL